MRHLWLVLAVLPLACSGALGDEVVLRNGDRVTGEVVRLENGALLVKTSAMGDVRIRWDAVASVSAETPLHVVADGAKVKATAIERTSNTDIVEATSGAFSLAPGHIKTLLSQKEQAAIRQQNATPWSGTLDLGLNAARGNSETTNFNFGLKGNRTTSATRLNLSFNSLLARSRGSDGVISTSANALRGGLRYEVNVSERFFVFGFGNFESDRIQHLDLRDVMGGGAGIRAAQIKNGAFDLFTGASMNQELFSPSANTQNRLSAEMLIGGQSSYMLSGRTSINGRISMFPNLTVRGDYRAVVDTSASTRLNNWIGWQVTLTNTYVTNPATGARMNDMLLSTGLRFTLGQERPFQSRTATVKFN